MSLNKHFFYLLAPALMTLSSCGHLLHLDRAQNNFSRGAELENQLKFDPQANISASPSMYYTLAYAELGKALNHKKRLSADNVLGTAYTVKALCEWKLKLYERAEGSADAALEELKEVYKTGIRLPRDKALMEALPHLMEIEKVKDSLYAFHQAPLPFEAGKGHYLHFIYDPAANKMARLEKAISEISKVQASVAGNEEVSAYFVMAQLAALKTWSDALDDLLTCIAEDASLEGNTRKEARNWQKAQGNEFLEVKEKELLDRLRTLIPTERGQKLADYWAELIGG